jgi:uncharacterized protein (DUF433 family)
MNLNYVEDREGTFYVNGSRVPLSLVVRLFDEGMSPEAIRSEFPTLTLAQVHGAIAFYLDHKGDVEVSIQKADLAEETFRQAHATPPRLKEKFDRARRAKTEIPSR